MDKVQADVSASTQVESEVDGSVVVNDAIVHLFNSHMSEVLDILSSRFPHVRGDGSMNEVEFQGLRAKVLRSGNNKIRKLPDVLKLFKITQMFDISVETISIGTPVKLRG